MWTYDPTDLDTTTASGRLNVVRLLVGDTDTLDQQVQNEEINFALLTEADDVYGSASWVARTLVAKYSRYVDIDLDGQLAESYSQLKEHYTALAEKLEAQKKSDGVYLGISAGGIKRSKMREAEADPDRVKPLYRRDSYKYPCTAEQLFWGRH